MGASLARRHRFTARLLAELQVRHLREQMDYAETVRLARPGTLAIDVGAYVGTFALGLGKAVGRDGAVLALEPQPDAFRELQTVTAGTRVRALDVAASDHEGFGSLGVPLDAANAPARQRASLWGVTSARSWKVRLARLDDLVDASMPVSVIKIDVEGHEQQVLTGAERVLGSHPALVIEVEQRHLGSTGTVKEVVESLLAKRYECQCIGRGNQIFPWRYFDLEADQLRWVVDGEVAPQDRPLYTNNFVFSYSG
ncbi:MAG: FkbM family methyltransferase [Acidimicrobiales bacterium]